MKKVSEKDWVKSFISILNKDIKKINKNIFAKDGKN
jgi:hypothetical protein